jgi:hypothetical protein
MKKTFIELRVHNCRYIYTNSVIRYAFCLPLNHFQLNINSHFKDSKFTLDVGLVDENFTFIHTHIYIIYLIYHKKILFII